MNESLLRLREAINTLHLTAGEPSGRELARRSNGAISHTAVSAVLRCRTLPTWQCMEPVVRQLGGEIEVYKELWIAAKRAASPGHALSTAERDDSLELFDLATAQRRLASKPHALMGPLTELRCAIEPMASFLAAERFREAEADELVALALRLQTLGSDRVFASDSASGASHREEYRAADADFHSLLLRGCGNDFFGALAGHVTSALNYRIEHDRVGTGGNKPFPSMPTSLAMWLHRGLAAAVQQRRCAAAEAFSRAILAEIREGPLPESVAQALRAALGRLDPKSMGPDGSDWPAFAAEINVLLKNEVWPGH